MLNNIHYRPYRPSGYTDDLGIIADRNQWVSEQVSGWYFWPTHFEWTQIQPWLDENRIQYKTDGGCVILFSEKDVVLFKLRWS